MNSTESHGEKENCLGSLYHYCHCLLVLLCLITHVIHALCYHELVTRIYDAFLYVEPSNTYEMTHQNTYKKY